SWKVRRGKRRCAACRYEWRPRALPLRLTRAQWRRLLRWFLLEQSTVVIARETRLEHKRVLRALRLVRQAMARDVPPAFSGAIELDETLLDRLRKNRSAARRAQGRTLGRGTTKQAVFRIMWREGQVRAEVIPSLEAKTLLPFLKKNLVRGTVVNSEGRHTYTGIAAGGHIHRLVSPRQGVRGGRGGRLSPLEGFWAYLKGRLASKGGIRLDRLPLYLAEYVWRYNHRSLSIADQVKRLLKLIQR
ncbi:MAG: IS1595 family transposase, partial [Chloroflexi bacterium]|nr:IS1595 family transposase [Chloroflexota bacterium]